MTTNAGQFQLTEEQLAIQEMAQRFTADNITPFAGEWDEKSHFPIDVIKQSAELGFGAIYVSEEAGGIGLGRLEAALIMEAMAYGCPATSSFISIHNMAAWMIDRFASEEIKAKYLPDLVTMEKVASYALTEPGSGSDAAGLKTSARLDGDHYVLNGTKQFISGSGFNDVYVTMVRTGDHKTKGITCLVIDKDTPGVSFGKPEKKLGWNASPTAQLIFEDARVPAKSMIGEEGDGFKFGQTWITAGRMRHGARALGVAERCMELAGKYATERSTFGDVLSRRQAVQTMLVDSWMETCSIRLLVYQAAARFVVDLLHPRLAGVVLAHLSKECNRPVLARSVVGEALEKAGWSGHLEVAPQDRPTALLDVEELRYRAGPSQLSFL